MDNPGHTNSHYATTPSCFERLIKKAGESQSLMKESCSVKLEDVLIGRINLCTSIYRYREEVIRALPTIVYSVVENQLDERAHPNLQ